MPDDFIYDKPHKTDDAHDAGVIHAAGADDPQYAAGLSLGAEGCYRDTQVFEEAAFVLSSDFYGHGRAVTPLEVFFKVFFQEFKKSAPVGKKMKKRPQLLG